VLFVYPAAAKSQYVFDRGSLLAFAAFVPPLESALGTSFQTIGVVRNRAHIQGNNFCAHERIGDPEFGSGRQSW